MAVVPERSDRENIRNRRTAPSPRFRSADPPSGLGRDGHLSSRPRGSKKHLDPIFQAASNPLTSRFVSGCAMEKIRMNTPKPRKSRALLRVAVAGAVALGIPLAIAGTANATPTANAAPASLWDRVAQCESSGNWQTNTGNGFYGGLQFTMSTWRGFGGQGMPHQASRAQQIAVAQRVLATQGWKAWPVCSSKLGLR
ncbi:hypothetical protein GCM10009608_10450 [Pseudonocardia alaniniphila]